MTFKDKILSETTYQNIQFFPATFLLGFSFLLMMVNYLIILIAFGCYGIFLMWLKFLKMTYTEELKNYRYVYAIIYDIDYHKVVSGYIVFDVNETFAISVSDKDTLTLEKEHLEKEIDKLRKRKKDSEKDLKEVKKILKELAKKSDKDKSKEEKDKEKKKEVEETELELRINNVKLQINRINQKILKHIERIEKIEKALDQVEPVLDSEQMKEFSLEIKLSEYKIYKTKILSSSFYEKDSEIFFLLPATLDESFIFTQDEAYYDEIYLEVPNYTIATFIESKAYNSIVLLCIMCSYFVNMKELTLIGKDKAEKLLTDAKISYLSGLISDIQNEHEMLQHDNRHLENQNDAILDQLEKMSKRDIERLEVVAKGRELSFELPDKTKYPIMIIGYVLAIIFAVAFFITLGSYMNIVNNIN